MHEIAAAWIIGGFIIANKSTGNKMANAFVGCSLVIVGTLIGIYPNH